MPFKIIKLSRRGRYILSHKNSFLVRVQLLNNTVMDCTLTVENTGNDCLNAVANKLDLKEVQYFGLQYRNKQFSMRWIELDKPLKKQVDKNAQDPTLYFRVMYYVANLELLQQEITRYLFYLQLKNNVIDGCLLRSPEEAIELASYMLQAEFGDYNPDVHSVQYFRDFILFPEAMAPNEEVLDTLTKETLTLHQRHRGLTAPDAEFNYILKVIHLDGYGEECYLAKDSQNTDYELRCSFVGVVTREMKSAPPSVEGKDDNQSMPQYTGKVNCYDWNAIDHIHCNKSAIILNMRKDDTTLQFQLEDVETAKYACRIFEMRRKFYSLNRQTNKKLAVENGETSIHRRPTLRRTQDTPIPELTNNGGNNEQHPTDPAQLQQQQEFISSQENLHYARHQEAQYYASQTSLDHAYVSQTSLNHVPGIQQEYGYANGYAPEGSMYSSTSINSLGHSQTQLNQRSPASSNMSLSSERHLGNVVPVYRCTPDYDQAVQQRRRYSSYLENQQVARQQTQNTAAAIQDGTLKPRPHSMIYSPHELLQQAIHGPHYAHYPPQNPPLHYHPGTPQRVDSSSHLPASQTQLHRPFESSHESLPPVHGLVSQPQTHPTPYNPHEVIQPQIRLQGGGQVPGNAFLAASTPELANSMQQVKGYSGSEMQLLLHYTKPPPPYPRNNSTSTPDLSAHRQSGVSASTPDLHKGYGVPQGQRRTQVHPTLVEDGAYGPMQEQHDGFPQTVIRGVCTSVEGLHRPHQNMMPQQQRPPTAEQTVQAYLQQLNLDHTGQAGLPRPRHRHPGQPQSRHHRPVSYPPRLNHSNQILIEEQDFGRLPPVVQHNTSMGNSQSNSSSSTVGSSYGSQQYIPQQHGSQISLQRAQLAPATQPVLTQYHPTPHRAEVHMTGSSGNIQYQPQAAHMHPAETPDSDEDEKSDTVSSHLEGVPRPPTPQHSQMASNVTMVIHGSDSENTSGSDDEYSSEDEDIRQKTDYRNAPLTTIDNWHREKPTEMYVPPKPKNEFQTYAPMETTHDMRPPPPYPEDQNEVEDADTNLSIPVIPVIATTDHDPPRSYRKPDMMESFDEGDIGQVSVFPHPNPSSLPHSPKLSNTNPFYIPDANSANPFYSNDNTQVPGLNVDIFSDYHADTGGINVEKGAHGLFADITSDGLRQSRQNMRKSPLKLSNTSLEVYDLPSPSAGTPDERVLQLEKQVEDGQVLIEFEKIPKTRDPGEILKGDPSGHRDRVKKALAYPENRIQISSTGANPEGYINASLIKSNVGGQEWQHILCQNPMEDFTEEFWEMVWDQNVCIIAMISREVEDGRNRCGRYWPEQAGDPNALLFGNYRISSEIISDLSQTLSLHGSNFDYDQNMARSRTGSTACENLITSRLLLQKAGTTKCRKVWHLQYVGWPDSGAPKDATDFLAFLEELESVRRLADDMLLKNGVPPPVLIHCASGSGRSGVFVLCDLMRRTLEHNETTTVPEMLENLRRQRPNVVQTVSQYNFVYQVLILFLKNSRLI